MTLLEQILSLHCPEAREHPMVYSVWEDGEITLEKGGELFGLRNLHCTIPGKLGEPLIPVDSLPLPNPFRSHSRILVLDYTSAMTAHKLLWPDSPFGGPPAQG